MNNLVQKLTFIFGTSTYFDEDEGWITKHFYGFYQVRWFDFLGWNCYQFLADDGTWYDLDR